MEGASAIVHSSAIKADNPEMVAGRAAHIPLVRRAEMLAELMRLRFSVAVGGTHGKTTTTSMVAAVLDAGGLDPTVVNGGIINAYGANAKVGEGEWIVVEADESDGTFLKLRATVAVVTNIDPEHLDHHGDFAGLKRAFADFVEGIPFYGFAALCVDDPDVQELAATVENRRLLTYGFNPQAEVRAVDLEMGPAGSRFSIRIAEDGEERRHRGHAPADGRAPQCAQRPGRLRRRPRAGRLRGGDPRGAGELRRRAAALHQTGVVGGVRIIDDYGHHPAEIAAVLSAARAIAEGRVIAVVQPHRYTRLRDLFSDFCVCFNDADEVMVADVYPAGEAPIEGFDRESLAEGVRRHGHRDVKTVAAPSDLAALIAADAQAGDLVVFLGAGDITAWAYALPAELEALAA